MATGQHSISDRYRSRRGEMDGIDREMGRHLRIVMQVQDVEIVQTHLYRKL